jgi:peptidoglycan/LPS O-acetylase OafA/YrhL
MSDQSSHAGPRLAVVDDFRGVAILMVLLGHCLTPAPSSPSARVFYELGKWMWLGVDLFFVLSGFLITRILVATAGQPAYFTRFYARRALRILPASYLVMLVTFLAFPYIEPQLADTGFQRLWPYFALYLQNWLFIAHPPELSWGGLGHTWSLAIEEQFYLAWPLVIWAVPARGREFLCLAGAAGVAALKIVMWRLEVEWGALFPCTFARADGLLLGGWLAVVLAQGGSRYLTPRAIDAIGWAALGIFALLFVHFRGTVVSTPIVAFVTPVAAIVFVHWLFRSLRAPNALTRRLGSRVLAWFARYSYGMYLIHWPVLQIARERLYGWGYLEPFVKTRTNWEVLVIGVLVITVTCAVAIAMFHLVEVRFLRLKPRWPAGAPSTSGSGA